MRAQRIKTASALADERKEGAPARARHPTLSDPLVMERRGRRWVAVLCVCVCVRVRVRVRRESGGVCLPAGPGHRPPLPLHAFTPSLGEL